MQSINRVLLFFFVILLFSCGKSYETIQAKVIDTQTEGSGMDKYFIATIEYQVNDSTYQSSFELNVWKTIEDTLMTPMQGVTFDIQYNEDDPSDILVNYRVKPSGMESL